MPTPEPASNNPSLQKFLYGRSEKSIALFEHFVKEYRKIGKVTLYSTKTMIGIATPRKRIAYVTQMGKSFLHVVFPFDQSYEDNLCFQKIAQVPGTQQFNHHFRMLEMADVNDETRKFMRMAYEAGL